MENTGDDTKLDKLIDLMWFLLIPPIVTGPAFVLCLCIVLALFTELKADDEGGLP